MKRHAEEAAPAAPAALPARPKGIPQDLGPPATTAEATHPWEEVRAEPCTTLPPPIPTRPTGRETSCHTPQ